MNTISAKYQHQLEEKVAILEAQSARDCKVIVALLGHFGVESVKLSFLDAGIQDGEAVGWYIDGHPDEGPFTVSVQRGPVAEAMLESEGVKKN